MSAPPVVYLMICDDCQVEMGGETPPTDLAVGMFRQFHAGHHITEINPTEE